MAGVVVGFAFDFYRSFRHWCGWGRGVTFFGDVLFSFVALAILFRFFLRANALDLRLYIAWGSLLGLVLYLRLLSRFTVRFFLKFYDFVIRLLELIHRGINIPIRGLVLLMRPPYAFLRWFSLLVYRMAEVLLLGPLVRIKQSINTFWNRLFPPRTNG